MKHQPIKMPFAKCDNNNLVHITEVETSDMRIFTCLSCSTNLIPVIKVKKRQKHFRHYAISACDGESVIHKAAKQIILEKNQITLPNKGRVSFESACDEMQLHGIIADVLAVTDGDQLVIEIYYRHKVDDVKIEKIKNANISAIEINLSALKVEQIESREALWLYMNDLDHVTWLHQASTQQIMVQEKMQPLVLTEDEKAQVRKVMDKLQSIKADRVNQVIKPLKRYSFYSAKALSPIKLPRLLKRKPTRL